MAEPFLPLLGKCSRASVASDSVRLLSLRCLGLLLKWPLQALAKHSRRLGQGLLKLLTWASGRGLSLGGGSELVQGCFKGLTTLLSFEPSDADAKLAGGRMLLRGDTPDDVRAFGTAGAAAAAAAAAAGGGVGVGGGGVSVSGAGAFAVSAEHAAKYAADADAAASADTTSRGPMVALNPRQMKALVRVLHGAVLDATHQTSSFHLVRVLVHQRVIVTEM